MAANIAPGLTAAIASEPANRDCPLCGSSSRTPLPHYSRSPWRLVACASCNFVYLENAPAYEQLVSEFAWEKSFEREAVRRKESSPVLMWLDRKTRWRLHVARPNEADEFRKLFSPGRVLDVGCGSGMTVPEPFIPYGVEISEALHAVAEARMSARGGRAVHAPAVDGVREFPDDYFSGVVLRSFLEHEVNPGALLAETRRVLAPDGIAYVKVPNYGSLNRHVMGAKWCGFRHPDHVNYFTLSSLRRMAEGCGLTLKLRNPVNLYLDDNIHAALTRRP